MRRWLSATLLISLIGLAAGTQAAEPATPGPADADLEWIYSCPSSKGCAFSCQQEQEESWQRPAERWQRPGEPWQRRMLLN